MAASKYRPIWILAEPSGDRRDRLVDLHRLHPRAEDALRAVVERRTERQLPGVVQPVPVEHQRGHQRPCGLERFADHGHAVEHRVGSGEDPGPVLLVNMEFFFLLATVCAASAANPDGMTYFLGASLLMALGLWWNPDRPGRRWAPFLI